jgi:FkbM family methyltransferase
VNGGSSRVSDRDRTEEFSPEGRQVPLILLGLARSVLVVRPLESPLEYYRALVLSLASSLTGREATHPGRFLRHDVWVRYRNQEYLLTHDTTFGYYLHMFEPETARFMAECSGEVFVDLGANTGQYVVPLASQFRKVVAVEPNPRAVEVLRRNLDRNRISNVEVVERAVMPRPGPIRLYKGDLLSTWSAYHPAAEYIEVDAVSLDALLQPYPSVDLLKIDIEGAEVETLLASTSLAKVKSISLAVFPQDVSRLRGKFEQEGFDVVELPSRLGAMENIAIRRRVTQ